MGGKTSAQRRARDEKFTLWPADASNGWEPIRYGVSFSEGLYMVARGKWALREHDNGDPWYFQVLKSASKPQDKLRRFHAPAVLLPVAHRSPAAITAHESQLNVQRSTTARMSEEKKLQRRERYDPDKPLPPEDAVELAQAKVKEWPLMHGDRAVLVYPKPG